MPLPRIGAVSGAAAAALVLLAVALLLHRRRQNQKRNHDRAPSTAGTAPSPSTPASSQEPASPHALQEGEVVIAMDDKGVQVKLGEGAFGEVWPWQLDVTPMKRWLACITPSVIQAYLESCLLLYCMCVL